MPRRLNPETVEIKRKLLLLLKDWKSVYDLSKEILGSAEIGNYLKIRRHVYYLLINGALESKYARGEKTRKTVYKLKNNIDVEKILSKLSDTSGKNM